MTNNNNNNDVKSVKNAIEELNNIVEESGILKDLDEERKEKLLATIKVCCNKGYLLLSSVLNKRYYPLMTEDNGEYLMEEYLICTVLNVIFPYTKDAASIHHMIKVHERKISDYCVDACLLNILDDDSIVQISVNYLSETFYNIY